MSCRSLSDDEAREDARVHGSRRGAKMPGIPAAWTFAEGRCLLLEAVLIVELSRREIREVEDLLLAAGSICWTCRSTKWSK